MANKITIIGAGSVYTPELVTEFFKENGRHIMPMDRMTLYDIDERRLNIVGGLAQRMARRQGVDAKLVLTTDLNEAVRDASIIITQIRVGGNQARLLDETIPLKFGVIGQETTGPGGMFKALRTIPELVKVAAAAKKLAPRAWILNFTNPAGLVAEAVAKAVPGARQVGVCTIQVGRESWVSDILGVKPERVKVKTVGLNHFSWVYGASLDGRDITDRFFTRTKKFGGWPVDLIRAIRAIPVGYLWYYYRTDEALKHLRHSKPRAAEILRIEKILLKRYADKTLDVPPEELKLRGGSGYSVMISTYVRALTGEKPVTIPTNTQNHGCFRGFDDDQSLEIPARISAQGIKPLPVDFDGVPVHIRGMMQRVKAYETLTCEAAFTGNYHKALEAMVTHPLVPDYNTGKKILDALLKAHRKYLPQFK